MSATPPPFELQPLVARPDDVRVFSHERRAGVAEVAPGGHMRLDAIARWAQDVAWADVEDAGLRELTIWLVRRTRVRVRRFPRLDERCRLDTYVTGVGRMWAERRTDIVALGLDGTPSGEVDVAISCIWVHIDPERLLPSPVHQVEIDTWTGPSTRPVKARLRHPAKAPPGAGVGSWRLRASEMDIAAHINNAAYFTPLDEELLAAPGGAGLGDGASAAGAGAGAAGAGDLGGGDPGGDDPGGVDVEIEYRTPAQAGDKRWLSAGAMRWLADPATGEVHASAVLADWPPVRGASVTAMSHAVGIPRAGGPDVLTVVQRPDRDPGENEIRIRVRYAAVNPTDIALRDRGDPRLPAPWTPGMDAAGEVDAVGPGVTRLAVGDAVMVACSPRRPEGGAQQERLLVPAASAVALPDGMTLAAAATLPMNGLTALLGLEMLGLGPGDTLAVSGGPGVLGSYVIALAHERGLRVIADARADETELVRGFGADVVVERSDDFAAAVRAVEPDGVAGVYDAAVLDGAALGAIRDGGGLAVVRGWDGPTPRSIALHRVMVVDVLERTEWLSELVDAAADGRLALRPLDAYPLAEAAEAQRRMDAGGLRGRVLIAP